MGNTVLHCEESQFESSCLIYYTILIVSSIILLLHLLALIKMIRFYNAIKFESLVIFGGLIECMIIIISVLRQFEGLLIIDVFIQNTIFLYIIKRLFRIVETQKREHTPFQVYHCVFIGLSIVNLLFFISQVLLSSIWKSSSLSNGTYVGYMVFTFSISTLMLFLGRNINYHIASSLRESTINADKINNELTQSEVYYKIRILQINLMIYSNFICSLYQLIHCLLKIFIYSADYSIETSKTIPLTKTTFFLHHAYLFSDLVITFFNYISFFWLIRKQFISKNHYERKKARESNDTYLFDFDTESPSSSKDNKLTDIERVLTSENLDHNNNNSNKNNINCRTESFDSFN